MPLTIILNGARRTFEFLSPGANLSNLVDALELKSDRIALELNGDLAPRLTWKEAVISDGDKLELVHFVGGGADTSLRG